MLCCVRRVVVAKWTFSDNATYHIRFLTLLFLAFVATRRFLGYTMELLVFTLTNGWQISWDDC